MQLKPMGEKLHVEIVENKPREGAPDDGLLAEVLAVGAPVKGVRKGDAILVWQWALPEDQRLLHESSFDGYRALIAQWDVLAKVTGE